MPALLETNGLAEPPSGKRTQTSQRRPPRRAPRHRVRTARRDRHRLPRLHRRQPLRRVAGRGAHADAARQRLRQPALRQPDLVGRDRSSWSRRERRCCASSMRPRASTRASSRRTPPARSGWSARRIRSPPVPRHRRQPQLGQRHPRVRPREGRRDGVRADRGARAARRPGSRITSTTPTAPASSPIPRSPTSRASSIRWSGSTWPMSVAGTCSWTAPRSRRRAGSTCRMWKPDFVAVSFYKMFGYPTGLGALIVRRRTLERLQRPWFSGGTVVAANVQGDMVVPHSGHAGFEDGTVDYLGIPAVEIGLRHLERIGIDTIAAASREPRQLAARGAAAAPALRREPRGPHLRADHVGPPRGHDRVQLPAPGRERRRRAPRRPRRRRPRHLPPDGLLLQPRRRRGRVLDPEGAARRRASRRG